VQFYAARSQDDPASFTVRGEASDNAATFNRSRNGISQRPATAQSVQWSNVGAWKHGDAQWTPNLAPIVQEIVGRSGWAAGNALALVISGDGERTAVAFDGHPAGAPVLYVEYMVDGISASAAGNAVGAVTNVVGSTVLLQRQFDASTPLGEDSPEEAGAQENADTSNWIFMPFTQAMP
jgi:hypothetical protein